MGRPIPYASPEPRPWQHEEEEEEETESSEEEEEEGGWQETEAWDADEQPWDDPTGGVLTDILNAAAEGTDDVLRRLLANLQDKEVLNTKGQDGDTALHLASVYGHADCAQCLLEAGASADARDEDGATPLHDAAAGGYLNVVQLLYDAAPSAVRAGDDDGDTPLHNAARGGHQEVVEFLLGKGADPAAVNKAFERPADVAERQGPVGALLQQACARPAGGAAADTR